MLSYVIRRLLLIIPTLLGILTLNFFIIQTAPGGPVEQMISKLEGLESGTTARLGGGTQAEVRQSGNSMYRGAQGLDPELIAKIEKMYSTSRSGNAT